MADDIESFIKEQKLKLAKDRNLLDEPLSPNENGIRSRKTWEKSPGFYPVESNGFKENIPPQRGYSPELPLAARMGSWEEKSKKFNEERKRDYNKMLKNQGIGPIQRYPKESDGKVIPGLRDSQSAKFRKQKERNQEYNEFLKQKKEQEKNRFAEKKLPGTQKAELSPRANSPPHVKQDDIYDEYLHAREEEGGRLERRRQIMHELEKEYKKERGRDIKVNHMDEKEVDRTLRDRNLVRRVDDRDWRDSRDRYYDELDRMERRYYERGFRQNMRDEDEFESSLPIKDRLSAQRKRQMERNKEYNELLRRKEFERYGQTPGRDDPRDVPPGARKGWGTPTYEEILEEKRKEENRYRRTSEDPVEYRLRPTVSDGYLNRSVDDDRYNSLDRMYEDRKVRFRDELLKRPQPRYGGLLDDDAWLDLDRMGRRRGVRDTDYRHDREFDDWERSRPRVQTSIQPPPLPLAIDQHERKTRIQSAPAKDVPTGGASLPIGEMSPEEKQRKKVEYRKDLEKQMEEAAQNKRRERINELAVNATGVMDIAKPHELPPYVVFNASNRFSEVPPSSILPSNSHAAIPKGYHPYSSSAKPIVPNQPPPSILSSQSRKPERPLGTGVSAFSSPLDDAYYYYGLQNPLEGNPNENPSQIVPPIGLAGFTTQPVPGHYSTRRVDFNTNSSGQPFNQRTPRGGKPESPEVVTAGVLPAHTEEETARKKRLEAQAYQQELERQIVENNMKKRKEKEDKERYDRKLEEEIMNYNPYGKGGGGAPMKDRFGNVQADLRKIHVDNEEKLLSPRKHLEEPAALSPRYNLNIEPTYARGGHGIFGDPKSDAEKSATDKYKEELQIQIEEKRRIEDDRRLKEKLEDEKEAKRVEEERLKIAREFEAEQNRIKVKDDEIRRQNEEIKKQAEDKRDELKRKREEEERIRNAESKTEYHRENQKSPTLHVNQDKNKEENKEEASIVTTVVIPPESPPVPAVKRQLSSPGQSVNHLLSGLKLKPQSAAVKIKPEYVRSNSPALPALRSARNDSKLGGIDSRANSADILNQLANMRKQLQNERSRVESALQHQKYDVNVFDARNVIPAPAYTQPILPLALIDHSSRRTPDPQVFDTAVNRAPVTVKRPVEDKANAEAKAEFQRYRHKENDSKAGFRRLHPESPVTGTALETQQLDFLREQEQSLKRLRNDDVEPGPSRTQFYPQRQGSTKSQLQSDSSFLDPPFTDSLPDTDTPDFPDYYAYLNGAKAKETARDKRRKNKKVSIPSTPVMGSTTSVDPDKLNKKNEQRMEKLNNLAADDISLASAEPDDIIDRFMAKQKYNRPPSGVTLEDDEAWMRPSDK